MCGGVEHENCCSMSHVSTQKPSYKGSDLHCELQLHRILWQKPENPQILYKNCSVTLSIEIITMGGPPYASVVEELVELLKEKRSIR